VYYKFKVVLTCILLYLDVRVEAQPGRLHIDGGERGRRRGREPQGGCQDVPPDSELTSQARGGTHSEEVNVW
jgi:hypothetical protein